MKYTKADMFAMFCAGRSSKLAYPYYYCWRNNSKRQTLHGRKFRVLVRLAMNSDLVEFENGQREVISRNAKRKVKG